MTKEGSDAEHTLDFFAKRYKGEELAPFTIFHGMGATCDECGWKC